MTKEMFDDIKYKYIGTEEQLIEHGFKKNDYETGGYSYMRNLSQNEDSDVIIFFKQSYFELNTFMHNWGRFDNKDIKPHIQDLIDDGLVEVLS